MRSTWRTWLAGLAPGVLPDIVLVCVADALVGMSFGAISVSGGLSWTVPVLMSLLVFAGGAQFAAVAVVFAGGSAAAAVLAGLVLNTRLLPFGFAVADVLGTRLRSVLPGAHVLTDEPVAFALRERDAGPRRAAYWTCAVALFVVWNLSVGVGVLAGRLVSDTDAWGLDAAFPAVLLALVLPSLSDGAVRAAALLGAGVAVLATPWVSPGLPVLLALAGLVLVVRRRVPEPLPEPATESGEDSRCH